MEYWLSFNNQEEKLQLPVSPSKFEISKGNSNTTINITNLGEINLIGKGRLATIAIESFFPAQEYSFCLYTGFPEPYECVAMIERWRQSGRPIRLIITETDINIAVAIENFNYGEQDGTGDVYFTLDLKEYRFINTPSIASSETPSRTVTKATPTTYTVKDGDTLYNIAKKLTGDGSNCTGIASKNGLTDANKIYPGQKLVI